MNNSYNGFTNNPMFNEDNQNYNTIDDSLKSILKDNMGKKVSIYQSFSTSEEWKDKIFSGILEESNKEYVILSDPKTGNWFMLFTKYTNFIQFDEEINISKKIYPSTY